MHAEEVQRGGDHQQCCGDLDAYAQFDAGLRGLAERAQGASEQRVGDELCAEEPGDRSGVAGECLGLPAGQRALPGDCDGQQPALNGEARQVAGGKSDQQDRWQRDTRGARVRKIRTDRGPGQYEDRQPQDRDAGRAPRRPRRREPTESTTSADGPPNLGLIRTERAGLRWQPVPGAARAAARLQARHRAVAVTIRADGTVAARLEGSFGVNAFQRAIEKALR